MPPDARVEVAPARPIKAAREPPAQPAPEPPREAGKHRLPASSRVPAIIVGGVIAAVAGLSIWYLVRPQPLLVQGVVDATRFDIAARVDGRVGAIPVERGQDVAAGAVLVRIDNPETIAKNEQSVAAKIVAEAQLANINAGTRAEVIAARKAELERAQASVVLAQKTYDRVSQLAEHGNAPIARLDQATDSLHENQRAVNQAKSAYEQAVNGYTKEEHEIAEATVGKAVGRLGDLMFLFRITVDGLLVSGLGLIHGTLILVQRIGGLVEPSDRGIAVLRQLADAVVGLLRQHHARLCPLELRLARRDDLRAGAGIDVGELRLGHDLSGDRLLVLCDGLGVI